MKKPLKTLFYGLTNEHACGTFAPFIHKVIPIAETAEGHSILNRGENRGKVVLTI